MSVALLWMEQQPWSRNFDQPLSSWGLEKYISQTKGGHAASFKAQENTDGVV